MSTFDEPRKAGPEYQAWASLRSRCLKPTDPSYKNYGGRGIRVCERWASFANFLEDMGRRPSAQHSIDRINNDGPYEPSNCGWGTRLEQHNNTRSNQTLTHKGVTKTYAQWAAHLGISDPTLRNRIKAGWPLDKVMAVTSFRVKIDEAEMLGLLGQGLSQRKIAALLGVAQTAVSKRLRRLRSGI